jgi:hypothetical protein
MNATSKNWTKIRGVAACFTAALFLTACNDDRKDAPSPSSTSDTTAGVGSSVAPTDASKSVAQGNTAPIISGSPSSTAKVGTAYNFQPSASDADGQGLGFSIANKPSWATFDTSTGALKGTPTASHVGAQSNIVISVSDGTAQASLASFSITVQAAGSAPGASAPTISGQAATAVKAGSAYSFQPSASDPNGDKLTFSVTGKPTWANFDTSTGKLSGTPATADIGSSNNIVISVSDGGSTVSLAPFSVLVSASTTGSATLSWTPPTANTDGTPVTNLGGYRIYYGTNSNSLNSQIQVSNAGLTSYTVGNLSPGTYYFAVAAYTADGIEGAASAVGSKTIM